MTGTDSRELLTAARTTKAQTGPGTLADYPVPGGDAHLLIHYAPGSRAYRFKLTAPGGNQVPPGTNQEPGTVPGNHPGPDGPAGDQDGSAPAPRRPAPPDGAAQPGPAEITVTIWHNIATDAHDRPAGMLDGYQPGHPMVRVFPLPDAPCRAPPGGDRRGSLRHLQRPPP